MWEFIGSYWWLIFPLGGVLGGMASGWAKAVRRWDERRRRHKLEMAKIKYGHRMVAADPGPAGHSQPPAPATSATFTPRQELDRLVAEHEDIDQRWLSYELDLAKLIDFPVMSDMREEVTVDFHRAKRTADGLRPEQPEAATPEQIAAYRDAVREYAITFEIAEREAKRRRATDFTQDERRTLERAKRYLALADDSGATHAERQQAYRRAQRALEGLIVIPDAADQAIQQRIAGALGTAPGPSPASGPAPDAEAGSADEPGKAD